MTPFNPNTANSAREYSELKLLPSINRNRRKVQRTRIGYKSETIGHFNEIIRQPYWWVFHGLDRSQCLHPHELIQLYGFSKELNRTIFRDKRATGRTFKMMTRAATTPGRIAYLMFHQLTAARFHFRTFVDHYKTNITAAKKNQLEARLDNGAVVYFKLTSAHNWDWATRSLRGMNRDTIDYYVDHEACKETHETYREGYKPEFHYWD